METPPSRVLIVAVVGAKRTACSAVWFRGEGTCSCGIGGVLRVARPAVVAGRGWRRANWTVPRRAGSHPRLVPSVSVFVPRTLQ